MLKKAIKFILIPLNLAVKNYWLFYNFCILNLKNVEYDELPHITGKIYVNNSGECKLGKNLTFKNTVVSNWVGLYKPCSLFIDKGATLIIGDNAGFSGVSIYCSSKIIIGEYLNCGGNVSIWDTDFHPINVEARRIHDRNKISTRPILIGDDVFIGANSIILKGVSIGNKCIIGAGSVVTKNIPDGEIWAGNPAKFLKKSS